MYEYGWDVDRGILLSERVRDVCTYPDFSAQALGVAISGIIMTILFKLFG